VYIKHVLQKIDGVHKKGMYEYPFEIELPAWLPSSLILQTEEDKTRLEVRYDIRA
jgi:hypothetical protein